MTQNQWWMDKITLMIGNQQKVALVESNQSDPLSLWTKPNPKSWLSSQIMAPRR